MKDISPANAKEIMLDILEDIASFCDNKSLTYFLAYGTLIGAIRHKGFIPWDDDIDIIMPREDYNRFIKTYQTTGKYKLLIPEDKQSFYVWTKAYDSTTIKYEKGVDYTIFSPIGIDIDIFPLDGLPSDKNMLRYKLETNYRNFIFRLLKNAITSLSIRTYKGRLLAIFCRAIGIQRLKNAYIRSASRYAYQDSSIVGFCDPYAWRKYGDRHPKHIFTDKIKVLFEGKLFWAPVGYDEYLSNIYGNYMQLPEQQHQITHHKNQLFWK